MRSFFFAAFTVSVAVLAALVYLKTTQDMKDGDGFVQLAAEGIKMAPATLAAALMSAVLGATALLIATRGLAMVGKFLIWVHDSAMRREMALNAANKEVEQLTQELEQRDHQLGQTAQQLEQMDQQLEEKDKTIQELREQIARNKGKGEPEEP